MVDDHLGGNPHGGRVDAPPEASRVRIGRIFGIEVSVHPTWPIIFALVAISLSTGMGPFGALHVSDAERIALAIFTTLLFFLSILLHELAHSLLARRNGIPVRGITLMIFGGVSQFEGEAQNAPTSGWISAIGPLASLALAAI